MNLTLVVSMLAFAQDGSAEGSAPFGEVSRTAAMANAVTAMPGDVSAMTFNPGALADIDEPVFTLSSQMGRLDMWFERTGEDQEPLDQTIAGFGFAVAAPLPGPDWLRAVRMGASVYIPAGHALEITAPERSDVPSTPIYGSRTQHAAVVLGSAVDLFSIASIGAGVVLTPELTLPTQVTYVQGRGDTPDENVVIDLERELSVKLSAVAGVRLQPLPYLSLGAAFQESQITRAFGTNDTQAGTVQVTDDLDFYDFWSPNSWSFGAAATLPDLTLSADATLATWSEYRTIHNRAAEPAFEDTWTLRFGTEWVALEWLSARLGYAFEPTPVQQQSGETNFVDADRHVIAFGAGFDLRHLLDFDMSVDVHVRTHQLTTQRADKSLAELPDGDADAEGQQIDNLGYPGFTASGNFWQAGLTLTFFVGSTE